MAKGVFLGMSICFANKKKVGLNKYRIMICFNLSNTLEKQQIEAFESRSRGHWDVSVLSPEASPFSS